MSIFMKVTEDLYVKHNSSNMRRRAYLPKRKDFLVTGRIFKAHVRGLSHKEGQSCAVPGQRNYFDDYQQSSHLHSDAALLAA